MGWLDRPRGLGAQGALLLYMPMALPSAKEGSCPSAPRRRLACSSGTREQTEWQDGNAQQTGAYQHAHICEVPLQVLGAFCARILWYCSCQYCQALLLTTCRHS